MIRFWIKRWTTLGIATAFFASMANGQIPLPTKQSTVIYLVRHAEPEFPPHNEDPSNPSLNEAGKLRASELATTLVSAGITRIFSTDYNRTRETVSPLANKLNLEIELYDPAKLEDFVQELMTLPGSILVSGQGTSTQKLVQLLGGDSGKPIDTMREFGRLYVVVSKSDQPAITAQLQYGKPPEAYARHLYGVKIKVNNMAKALGFYGDLLGFEVLLREHYPNLIALKNEMLPLFLEQTDLPSSLEYGKSAQAAITFQTNDLKKRMAELKSRGVKFITEIGKVGVGISARFQDPSGNVHSMLEQTVVETPEFVEPRIYNVGFAHPDMAKAREFYCDKLGFVVRTEKYYPPAIPLGHRDGSFSHMLHEKNGLKHVRTKYPDEAQTVILYRVPEFNITLRLLRHLKVDFIQSEPQVGHLGRFVSIRDPFGVISEIVELQGQ